MTKNKNELCVSDNKTQITYATTRLRDIRDQKARLLSEKYKQSLTAMMRAFDPHVKNVNPYGWSCDSKYLEWNVVADLRVFGTLTADDLDIEAMLAHLNNGPDTGTMSIGALGLPGMRCQEQHRQNTVFMSLMLTRDNQRSPKTTVSFLLDFRSGPMDQHRSTTLKYATADIDQMFFVKKEVRDKALARFTKLVDDVIGLCKETESAFKEVKAQYQLALDKVNLCGAPELAEAIETFDKSIVIDVN